MCQVSYPLKLVTNVRFSLLSARKLYTFRFWTWHVNSRRAREACQHSLRRCQITALFWEEEWRIQRIALTALLCCTPKHIGNRRVNIRIKIWEKLLFRSRIANVISPRQFILPYNSLMCINIARQRVDKRISATNVHATIGAVFSLDHATTSC